MLNKQPIFLNCFGRGGSTLLVNLLVSHPNVCISSGETHRVFKPGTKFDVGLLRIKKRFFYDYPIRILSRQDVFSAHLLEERKPIPEIVKKYADQILFEGRYLATIETHNMWQYENVKYTREELTKCRLLTKGLNGMAFAVDIFRDMYPDAVFFALVRNGMAICEGRRRRGYPLERMAIEYVKIVEKMLKLEETMPNYHLFKFEDLVADPVGITGKLYELAGLDLGQVPKIRLESRPIMNEKGEHVRVTGERDGQVFWYKLEDLPRNIKKDVNKNQLAKISPADKKLYMQIAGHVHERLGYPMD